MSEFVILHKKKDTLNRLCCIMKVPKQTLQHLRKKVPLANTIHHSTFVYNSFKKLNLCFFSQAPREGNLHYDPMEYSNDATLKITVAFSSFFEKTTICRTVFCSPLHW